MADTTVYDLRLRYIMEDRATRPMKGLTRQMDRTAKSSRFLRSAWTKIAALGGVYFGGRAAVKALIGYNASMQQARIQMAGMIQLTTNRGWTRSLQQSSDLVGQLQERARKSVGTTKDMVQMASMIARPVIQAGLSMKDLENMTAQAVVASRAFNLEAGYAARDIEAALMGKLRSVDRFSRALLEPVGYIGEAGREAFNAMSAAQRAATLQAQLGSQAIMNMAKAQEQSFSGVYSTFQDNLQIFLGKVGKPLFQALTKEIQGWNKWITANADRVEEMARKLSSGLRSVFGLLKDVAGFFVTHASTLISIAKVWAAYKIGGMVGGMVGRGGGFAGRMTRKGGAGLLMGRMNKAGLGVAKFGVGISNAASSLAKFIPYVGLAGAALVGIHNWWTSGSRARAEERVREAKRGTAEITDISLPRLVPYQHTRLSMLELQKLVTAREEHGAALLGDPTAAEKIRQYKEADPGAYLKELQMAQVLGRGAPEMRAMYQKVGIAAQKSGLSAAYRGEWTGKRKEQAAAAAARRAGFEPGGAVMGAYVAGFAQLDKVLSESGDAVGTMARILKGTYLPTALESAMALSAAAEAAPGKDGPTVKPPKINVTIQRIEVKSNDPDRFIFDLVETFEDVARTGTYKGGR